MKSTSTANSINVPPPLEDIDSDIRAIEKDIVRMLSEVTGSGSLLEK